jgi:hypothetical protein
MRSLRIVTVVFACIVGACSDDASIVATSGSPASVTTASSSTIPATTNHLDAVRAQLAVAASDVCAVVTAEHVRSSFRESTPLTTQPMSEGSGPACGYPHPREGGYLVVIQFQELARWGGYAKSGKLVQGLGYDAVLTGTTSPQLMVRDAQRSAVVMFLAPDPAPIAVEALLEIAAFAYGVPREGVRFGE